jgi:hypothetical protein
MAVALAAGVSTVGAHADNTDMVATPTAPISAFFRNSRREMEAGLLIHVSFCIEVLLGGLSRPSRPLDNEIIQTIISIISKVSPNILQEKWCQLTINH